MINMDYGIHHITINVKDLEASKIFYEEGLGLEQKHRVDMGDHQIQYYRLSGEALLELITYDQPSKETMGQVNSPSRYRHMALSVSDIETFRKKLYTFLEANPVASITMDLSECPKLQFRNMLIEDPNGVEIEIVETIG